PSFRRLYVAGFLSCDRMISPILFPSPSSVPRWLTICLQWLLFQQIHYHGSESRILRGIELFLSTRENPLRMINSYLGMVFGRPAGQTAQCISLTVFQERYGSFVGLVVSHSI